MQGVFQFMELIFFRVDGIFLFSQCCWKNWRNFFSDALEKLEKLEKLFFQFFFSIFFFHQQIRTITGFNNLLEKMEKYFIIKDILDFIFTHTEYFLVRVCEKMKY